MAKTENGVNVGKF